MVEQRKRPVRVELYNDNFQMVSQATALRDKGYSYGMIANRLGIPRGSAQYYSRGSSYYYDPYSKIVFPEIRSWMKKTGTTYTEIARHIGKDINDVRSHLFGEKEPRKYFIDCVLWMMGRPDDYMEVWRT